MSNRHVGLFFAGVSSLIVLVALSTGRAAWAAGATTCGDGVAATVGDDVDCTVAPALIPTTVTFSNNPQKTLILNGAAPSGNVTNLTNGQGVVTVQGTVTSAGKFGNTLFPGHYLQSQTVNDGATFNLGHELSAVTVTVGQGVSGVLNQSAGFINASDLILSSGAMLTQSGSGVIQTGAITLGNNASLTLSNQGGGAINGAAAGQGSLIFTGNYNTDAALGSTNALASITVADGANLSLDENASATTFTVGQGASGIVSQSGGILSATTLAVGANGSFTQSGSGVVNANMTIGSGGAVSLRNQGSGTINGAAAGQGALTFTGNYNTDAALGSTNALASITIADTGNLILDQNASATTFTVGQGASGIVGQSSGILSATTLAVGANGSFTQSGSGVVNADMTIGSGGILSLRNQGTGTINGATAGQGALIFTGNYNTDAALGSTNALASITVADTGNLSLDENASATTFTVGQGASGIVSQSGGILSATTLAVGANGSFTQSGSGVVNANMTIGSGGAVSLRNQGSGTINGAAAGQGALTFTGNYNTDQALGGSAALASITVADGSSLSLDENASATIFTVGQGASGIVGQSSGILSATTLAVGANGSFTQSGSGVVNANMTIGSGGILSLRNQGSGTINGAGAGQGALIFTGNYNTDAALGSTNALASITVADGANLSLDENASATTFTVGQGASGTVSQSAGALNAITLAVGANGSFTQSGSGVVNADMTIGSGGILSLRNQGSGTINGAGAGQGALTFSGNYNTDATLGSTNALASITIANGANLSLDENASATTVTVGQSASGTVSQSAGILSASTLAVGANGSFTQSGSGVVNADMTIGSGGILSLRNQGSGTINGAAAGQGSLIFTGNYNTDAALGSTNALASITVADTGNLILDQNASATTFIVNGTVNHGIGSLAATAVNIQSGGVFNQTGAGGITTAATTIQDGGTMNFASAFAHNGTLTVGGGNSGTLNVGGNILTTSSLFTMNAGSTLKVTINADTANDVGRIVATGVASVAAGSTINITVTPDTLTAGQTYLVITGGAGGSVNIPATVIDNSAAYKFIASTDGDALILTAKRAGNYVEAASSVITSAVAAALKSTENSGTVTADMLAVLAELDGMATDAEKDTAMATMAPDAGGGLTAISVDLQNQAIGTVDARLDTLRTDGLTAGTGIATGNPGSGAGIWVQGFVNHGVQDERKGAAGFKANTVGMAVGGDRILADLPLTLGVSYAQAGSSLDYQDARSGNGSELDSHLGALYGSYDGGQYYIDAIANVAFNTYETNRQIRAGTINRQAKGNFNGRQYSAKVVAGYPMGNDGYAIVPMVSAQATRLHLDSYTETGADALNLHVDAQSYDYLQTGLGIRATFNMKVPAGTMSASFKTMWLYDAVADSQAVSSIFTGDGGEAFTVNAPEAARHAAQLSAGLHYETGGGLSLVARYEATIKDEYLGHAATATIRYDF